MAYPKINTLTDIFQVDGFGFFGFGDGGFGGSYELINPQWNTNSGSFGFDPIKMLPFVEATETPSYVGASLYDLTQSNFFAKITPAPAGNGSIQTGLLIRFDRHNYVEMSYGPNGQFNAYVSNDSNVTTTAMPAYDSVAHAYWRIRNEDPVNIFFDTSPDGSTWTEQGFVGFNWDISAVTVSIFAGFNAIENPSNLAYISNVNAPATSLQLKGHTNSVTSITGGYIITDPNALSGNLSAKAGFRGKFTATLGIPEGGMSDFAYNYSLQNVDPLILNPWTPDNTLNFTGIGSTLTQASWWQEFNAFQIPMPYRDGSYFQPAAYVDTQYNVSFSPDTATQNLLTNVQMETTTGLDNRLPLVASIYLDGCAYSGGSGVSSITRSTERPLNGQYSGKIVSSTSAGTLGDGNFAYWVIPQRRALTKVRFDPISGGPESLFGSVYLSTSRANTIWFAGLIYYDANFNIMSASTHLQASITNKVTHPGGNVWRQATVYATNVPATAVYASVVPFVQVSSATPPSETVYTSNNSITTASLGFTEAPSAYEHPKTAHINVKADRVNYALNSGFNANTANWFQGNVGISGTPNSATLSWDGAVGYRSVGSLRMDLTPPSGTYTGGSTSKIGASTQANFNGGSRQPIVQGLKVGHTYTISAWIMQGTNCPDVFLDFRDSNGLGVGGVSVNTQKITNPENIDGTWTRVQFTYTVPPTGLSEYYMYFYVLFPSLSQAPFSYWVDSIMVEETIAAYEGYFDGGFASADYKWESGGPSNNSRSYYYKDYNNKFTRLSNAINSVLPVGEYYSFLFAQPIA